MSKLSKLQSNHISFDNFHFYFGAKPEIYSYESLTFGHSYSAVLEIFYQDFCRKALLLVIPTVLEIFYRDLCRKALLLVNPTVEEIF